MVVDKEGKKREVVFSVRDSEKLLQELENLRDALELDDRARTVKKLVPMMRCASVLSPLGGYELSPHSRSACRKGTNFSSRRHPRKELAHEAGEK